MPFATSRILTSRGRGSRNLRSISAQFAVSMIYCRPQRGRAIISDDSGGGASARRSRREGSNSSAKFTRAIDRIVLWGNLKMK